LVGSFGIFFGESLKSRRVSCVYGKGGDWISSLGITEIGSSLSLEREVFSSISCFEGILFVRRW